MLKKEKKRAAEAMKTGGSAYIENDSSMSNGDHSSGKLMGLYYYIIPLYWYTLQALHPVLKRIKESAESVDRWTPKSWASSPTVLNLFLVKD